MLVSITLTYYLFEKRDFKNRKCNKHVQNLLNYSSRKIKQLWNLRHLLSCFDWLHTNGREQHSIYLTTWRWSTRKGQNLVAVRFFSTSLSNMHARRYNVNRSSLRNIITLTLYSKQTSRWRLQKEMRWLHPARTQQEWILETNFWYFKNMNTASSTRNRCSFLVQF